MAVELLFNYSSSYSINGGVCDAVKMNNKLLNVCSVFNQVLFSFGLVEVFHETLEMD
jgi:hypothetical protein